MNKIVFLLTISLSLTCYGFPCKENWQKPCSQRRGAKFKHEECYNPFDHHTHYTCLNRKNIVESVIANTKIFENTPSNKINYFEYFTKQNDTHILCGNNGLEKNCESIWTEETKVFCKKEESDLFGKHISQIDVCKDFQFMTAKKFTRIDHMKRQCK